MVRVFSGSPVPRRTVFILADGSFVVQWDEHRVQDLLSGHYRKYEDRDFGHTITDYELNQLKQAGRVEHFNNQYIWLYALPEQGRFAVDREYSGPARLRSYYLNTTLPEARLAEVEARLRELKLDNDFLARARGGLVAVLGKNGAPFRELKDAERNLRMLIGRASDLFQNAAIAFIETSDHVYARPPDTAWGALELATILESQNDVTVTQNRRVLIVTSSAEEQQAIQELLESMQMQVIAASTGGEGLQLLEDHLPDLLIMDLHLPDMHGWEMLAKIREIGLFEDMPKLMIADHHSSADDQAFAFTVGRVDAYLVKPVSMAQLRQNVWLTLKNRQDSSQ
jgi:CheY-like chemotaxis protein